ncbi:hypothetical protein [Nocardioides sp.]|uniref:hypothetical protein n=1 Tax=Nocardioides sp. TaxID=35761 RepID=UPI0031FF038A|nr:hypothetical protein [Nocardioides sp.]
MRFPRPIEGLEKKTSGFDFIVGEWNVANERLRAPLSGQTEWYDTQATARAFTLHNGAVSMDEMWYAEAGFAASAFRLYDAAQDLWTIYWVSSDNGTLQPPVYGRWNDAGDHFEARGPDEFQGRPILARFLWHSIKKDSATWEQAFSVDDGDSWETNWRMHWTRA